MIVVEAFEAAFEHPGILERKGAYLTPAIPASCFDFDVTKQPDIGLAMIAVTTKDGSVFNDVKVVRDEIIRLLPLATAVIIGSSRLGRQPEERKGQQRGQRIESHGNALL